MTPTPTFDETRPHPFVDPVKPDGTLSHQTPLAARQVRYTVRNPIRRMRNGTRSGHIDWQATAADLAEQLYKTKEAELAALDRFDTCHKYGKEADDMWRTANRRLGQLQAAAYSVAYFIQDKWWFRLFAPAVMKAQTAKLLAKSLGQ